MNVASLECCKELHELSGWRGTDFCYYLGSMRLYMPAFGNEPPYDNGKAAAAPAYDLGYLLRKLPAQVRIVKEHDEFPDAPEGSRAAQYRALLDIPVRNWLSADTPEDAAAILAIALFKQGVLAKQ